jgi:hypothetical protein
MKLSKTDKMEVAGHILMVNGRQFNMTYPQEPPFAVKDGKLVTLVFRGCGCTLSEWDPEEIEGGFR